jgi:hypothetical protein
MKVNYLAIRKAAMRFGNLDPRDHDCFSYRRSFRSLFGCNQTHVKHLWNTIDTEIKELPFTHIGWLMTALYFLRCYPTFDELAVIVGKNTVTIRKHVWEFIDHLASLEMVRDHKTYPWLTWTDPANIVQLAIRKRIANVAIITSVLDEHTHSPTMAQKINIHPGDKHKNDVDDVVPIDNDNHDHKDQVGE